MFHHPHTGLKVKNYNFSEGDSQRPVIAFTLGKGAPVAFIEYTHALALVNAVHDLSEKHEEEHQVDLPVTPKAKRSQGLIRGDTLVSSAKFYERNLEDSKEIHAVKALLTGPQGDTMPGIGIMKGGFTNAVVTLDAAERLATDITNLLKDSEVTQ